MARYFSIDVATRHDVVYAYRGDDDQNTIGTVPADDQAVARMRLPADVQDEQLDDMLTSMFVPLALRNANRRILIRVGDNNEDVTAWVVSIPS